MNRLETDCRTGQSRVVKLTNAEVAIRLGEMTGAMLDEEKREREQTKAQLIDASNRLEQAAALVVEGVLDNADVETIQQEVDALKVKLRPVKPMEL